MKHNSLFFMFYFWKNVFFYFLWFNKFDLTPIRKSGDICLNFFPRFYCFFGVFCCFNCVDRFVLRVSHFYPTPPQKKMFLRRKEGRGRESRLWRKEKRKQRRKTSNNNDNSFNTTKKSHLHVSVSILCVILIL